MKIVVCVKQVPDSAARITVEDGVVKLDEAPLVINPWDEYAAEAALVQAEKWGGQVVALSFGPERAKEALKHALAMGCQEAVLVSDEGVPTPSYLLTAPVLAAAVRRIGEVDLVVMGRQAIDTDLGITHIQTARLLGWPVLTLVSAIQEIDLAARILRVERSIETGRQVVESRLPAVVSVIKDIGEPRYPSFMGIRKAQKALIPVWTLADLGVSPEAPDVTLLEVFNPPQRQVETEIITGGNPQEIAEKLVQRILAEGIL